jgi:ADP-ribose 1''-phosphate phosphatase
MSAKRAAATAGQPGGSRQFKQTKLSFGSFVPTSRSQQKRPRLASEEVQDISTTSTAKTKHDADPENEQSVEELDGKEVQNDQKDNKTNTETSPAVSPRPSDPKAQPPNSPPAPSTTPPKPSKIRITDKIGDLFDAPPNTLLIRKPNTLPPLPTTPSLKNHH